MPDLENLLNVEDEVTQIISDLGIPEKLNEMDDFMNQNDLKVQITNENATVTGLVTYTCTVKDKNNTALPNRVVEWYKGTTLLGMDATDSNGISTFKHHVSEADIYDVHAIVRGTHAGDDIRMFVKDNSNKFSDNIWSGGDTGDISASDYSRGSAYPTVSNSTDWSSQGDKSIKITTDTPGTSAWVRFAVPIGENDVGKTVTFKLKAHLISGSAKLIGLIDSSSLGTDITVSSDDEYTLSGTISAGTNLYLQIRLGETNTIYLDDIQCHIL